jgi:hypothetical protein
MGINIAVVDYTYLGWMSCRKVAVDYRKRNMFRPSFPAQSVLQTTNSEIPILAPRRVDNSLPTDFGFFAPLVRKLIFCDIKGKQVSREESIFGSESFDQSNHLFHGV